ncbi:MAG: hypothetical protein C6I05_03600 [Epsilonproteobacteria bacterium]|nr:hypothetical protein [Campylobacterota bacterium]
MLLVPLFGGDLEEIVTTLAGKKIPHNGFYYHYGPDQWDWVYASKDGSFVAKLDGIKDFSLKWVLLKSRDSTPFGDVQFLPDGRLHFGELEGEYEWLGELSRRELDYTGIYYHYDGGQWDWIYVSRNGSTVAKLDGVKDGQIQWGLLKVLGELKVGEGVLKDIVLLPSKELFFERVESSPSSLSISFPGEDESGRESDYEEYIIPLDKGISCPLL